MWDIVQNVLNHDTYQFDDLVSSDWLSSDIDKCPFEFEIGCRQSLQSPTCEPEQNPINSCTWKTQQNPPAFRAAWIVTLSVRLISRTTLSNRQVQKKKHPNLLLKIKIKNGSKKKAGIWLASNPHLSTTTSKSAVSASGSPLGVMQRIASWGCGGWIVRLLHEPQEVKISTIQRCHWEYHWIPHAALSSGRPTSIPLPGTQQMVKKTGDR